MYDIDKTIKHFTSLQKRYTTEHNGKACERVEDALEALRFYKHFETLAEEYKKFNIPVRASHQYFF